MTVFRVEGGALIVSAAGQLLRIEPWGEDALRIRATPGPPIRDDLPQGLLLLAQAAGPAPDISLQEERATLRHGRLAVVAELAGERDQPWHTAHLRFLDVATGDDLLSETPPGPSVPPAREFYPFEAQLYHLRARFCAYGGERLYGLGQHQHGRLDQKGLTVELRQRNMEVSIPFLLSSRGYGLLWNNPAVGRVDLNQDATVWVAEGTAQMDYWLTAGAPADILRHYADATGHAPPLPEWATGLWQCKLRYRTQEELLSVAREYHRRGLPLSVIVIDGMHWTLMGEWQFDPTDWPDPTGMVRELEAMGVRVMVSVWPTVNPLSAYCEHMRKEGWLVRAATQGGARGGAATQGDARGAAGGEPARMRFIDKRPRGWLDLHLVDATHPGARRFLWQRLREGYYRHGIRLFWLDADEPEMEPLRAEDLRFYLGEGRSVANLYPLCHSQGVYEGLRGEGETDIVTLNRSAWAGSQRYGAAVWSGDVPSTWQALRAQVPAGLNIALSGIPWWTTDIGGFRDGDPGSPEFRELLIRWFEYGVFCPLLRMHGFREPTRGWDCGGPNELWSFGEEAYRILRDQLFLRERLRAYIGAAMRVAHEQGLPPMRPLFVDFPGDATAWLVEDAYLFGPDLLVAPVLEPGARSRRVYLPAGAPWRDAHSGQTHEGGRWLEADAPLERIPVFVREGVDCRRCEGSAYGDRPATKRA